MMQQRAGLKDVKINTLGKHARENNRAAQQQMRSKQRMDQHQNGRNILESPPIKNEQVKTSDENKENQACKMQQEDKKLTYKEQYLKRFLEWKAQKEQQKIAKGKTGLLVVKPTNARRSVYVLRDTPKRVKPQPTNETKCTKNLARKLDFKTANKTTTQRNVPTIARDQATKPTKTIAKLATSKTLPNLVTTQSDCKPATTKAPTQRNVTIKPTTSKTLPYSKPAAATTYAATSAGAAHKMRLLQQKQQSLKAPIKDKNKLSVPLKAKKVTAASTAAAGIKRCNTEPTTNNNRNINSNIKAASKLINNIKPKAQQQSKVKPLQLKPPVNNEELLPLNTPIDVLRNSGRFDPTVTSTQQRCGVFDFETATQNTTMVAHKVKQRNLSRQIAVDLQFVRDDRLFVEETPQQAEETVHAAKLSTGRTSLYLENTNTAAENTMLVVEHKNEENLCTMQAVLGFRSQLQAETDRLHALCDQWAAYREQHLQLLQGLNVDDMIDAAIGQTKLLTSKKFQQFNGLITRCEAGVKGENMQLDDGSEASRLITVIDLEGFWSMLQLQVVNIDKRFANLERWKAHNWTDPDAVVVNKPKVLKKKKAVIKAHSNESQASTGLRDMIRKAQAEMRKKQQSLDADMQQQQNSDSIKIFTTNRTRRNSSNAVNETQTGRRSILVRDRKQFSNSPTILIVNDAAPSATPRRTQRQSYLLRAALGNAANPEHSETPLKTTPLFKSILKTPGTARSARKSRVSFSYSSLLKGIKFITGSSDSECEMGT